LAFGFGFIENDFVRIVVLAGFGFHFHHNTSIHLEETAVRVPGKLRIAGFLSEGFNDFVVDTEVKNGVHHPGHRLTSTGANGKEERGS
jgi:hypothetical protein